jgi:hypothetical protein
MVDRAHGRVRDGHIPDQLSGAFCSLGVSSTWEQSRGISVANGTSFLLIGF